MGLFQKLIDRYTEEETEGTKKTSFWDQFFEEKEEGKKGFFDQFFEEEETKIDFADAQSIDEISESLSEKIREKRKELKILGMSLTSINLKAIPNSEVVAKEYIELLDELESISKEEENVENSVLAKANLERRYDEFERMYQERMPRIKTLYLLSETMKENKNMKRDYERKPITELTQSRLEGYKEYINKISIQNNEFHPQFKKQLVNELLTAEYRLRMLILMRDVSIGEEGFLNPFAKETSAKKKRYEEIFLEDIQQMNEQYEKIMRLKEAYIRSKLYTERDFKEIDDLLDSVIDSLNNGMIDDFSIIEIFSNREYDTLKKFAIAKVKMNEIESKLTQIKITPPKRPSGPDTVGEER